MNSIAEYQFACELEKVRTQLAMGVEREKHKLEKQRDEAKVSAEKIAGYGQSALRGAFVLNGGAAVAVLAQLGTLSTRIGGDHLVSQITPNLVLFAIGAAVSVVASFFSYWTQNEWAKHASLNEPAGVWAHVLQVIAVVTGIASMGLFVWAVVKVACAFAPG